MINGGKDFLRLAPWISMAPGLAIAFTVLGFNLLGDGLRDALDPTSGEKNT
jgi:ABC-type dipeptide/oligopeptide/nickel transport system permease subunit